MFQEARAIDRVLRCSVNGVTDKVIDESVTQSVVQLEPGSAAEGREDGWPVAKRRKDA